MIDEDLNYNLLFAAIKLGCRIEDLPQVTINDTCSRYNRKRVERLYHFTSSEALAEKIALYLGIYLEKDCGSDEIPF